MSFSATHFFRFAFLLFFSLLAACSSERAEAARDLPSLADLAEEVSPAVVHISTTRKIEPQRNWLGGWGELWGKPSQPEQAQPRFVPGGLGSGFVLSSDGYVLTNHHVADDAHEILVRLSDGRELVAEVIGSDERSDIALLKVDAENLPAVKIGDPDKMRSGDWVIAIGQPFGFDKTVTAGVVSGKGRVLPGQNYVPLIQTDVAINPGNSGGPLFNLKGEVVGMNSSIYTRSGGYMGVSFAIPIDLVTSVVEQLKDGGSVARGWLGISMQEVDRGLAQSVGLDRPRGALVNGVSEGSPADKSGLEVGDVILSYNGELINSTSELPPLVGATPIGERVEMEIMRFGKTKKLSVEIGRLDDGSPANAPSGKKNGSKEKLNSIGLLVGDLQAIERRQTEVEEGGVILRQVLTGVAADVGLRNGDVILRVNGKQVDDADDFIKTINKLESGDAVALQVLRAGRTNFVALPIPD
ncbi:MAG: serine protease Do [Pseudoalteromonas tetraodonis]|jgi:serine protease Do